MDAPAPRLILASASPRRQQLLSQAGYLFTVQPSRIDEQAAVGSGIMPGEMARRLAIAKAEAVANNFPEQVILGADTVVAFGDFQLGKPTDANHARWMLSLLENTTHIVITGVAVIRRSTMHHATARVMSAVRMRPLTRQMIDRYVESGLWEGKAGGYGIQDNDPFVARLSGCLTNIVGLPMTTTGKMLRDAGIIKQ